MSPFEIVNPNIYQLLVVRVLRDEHLAAYMILINACCEILRNIPITSEGVNQMDSESQLVLALEILGKAIGNVLPGGADEFEQYVPRKQ